MKLKNKRIKFKLTEHNHLIIDCKVNGVYSKFLIDTGASYSCYEFIIIEKYNINLKISKEIASSATDKIKEDFFIQKIIYWK